MSVQMSAQQLAAHLDQPLWKIEKALTSLRKKGLVESFSSPGSPDNDKEQLNDEKDD